MLVVAYRSKTMLHAFVFEWFKLIKERKTSVESDKHVGHLTTRIKIIGKSNFK